MLLEWASRLWPDRENRSDFITIWIYKEKRNGRVISDSYHFPLRDSDRLVKADSLVRTAISAQHQVYYGIGTRAQDLGLFSQGTAEDVLWFPALWCDLDVFHPIAHKSKEYPPDNESALAHLLEIEPPPSIVKDTGHGTQPIWLLSEPVKNTAEFIQLIQAREKRIQRHFRLKDWKVDTVSSATRILRLPGTVNFKVSNEPKPVRIIVDNDVRYELQTWVRTARRRGQSFSPGSVSSAGPFQPPPHRSGASVFRVILEQFAHSSQDEDRRSLIEKLLAGQSLADPGERDHTLNRVCSIVAFTCSRDHDPSVDDLIDLFRESLGKWASETDAQLSLSDELDKARDKLSRALDDFKDRRDRARREAREFFSGLGETAGPSEQVPVDEDSDEPPPPPNQSTDVRQFLILQHHNAYFVWSHRRRKYIGPFIEKALPIVFQEELSNAPGVELVSLTPKGPKPKTEKQVVLDYGRYALTMHYDLTIDRSRFDAEKAAFHFAACPRRELEPLYDEAIHEWLMKLGGSVSEKFFDWLATFPVLTRQTCAPCLIGSKDSGKTLLGDGLSRIWTIEGPTEIDRIMGQWNADLLRCPFIVADEGMNIGSTRDLRRMIGSTYRHISQKFMPNISLHGCVRLMVMANNDDILPSKEDLTDDDLSATSDRFLYIRVTEEPQKFLRSLGAGYTHRNGWVSDDRIARHVIWLSQNRVVTSAQRFLVMGHESQMHRKLVTKQHVVGMVLEWLVKLFVDQKTSKGAGANSLFNRLSRDGLVQVGDGKFLITSEALVGNWSDYMPHMQQPTTNRIGRALRQISNWDRRIGSRRMWEVKLDMLYDWCEENTYGDVESIQQAVNSKGGVS